MRQCHWRLLSGAFAIGVMGVAVGCSKSTRAAEAEPPADIPSSVPAGPALENPNYTALLMLPEPCRHGQPCMAHAVIEAKGDYHINDAYPYKFRIEAGAVPGLTYPKTTIGREDGQFEAKRAILKVPFSADQAGPGRLRGTLSLSVCSAANCLMDKQPLELTVKVD